MASHIHQYHTRSAAHATGTLSTSKRLVINRLGKKEVSDRVSKEIYELAIRFFTSLTPDQKEAFYSQLFRRPGTIYDLGDNLRIDVQNPLRDKTNIQVQFDSSPWLKPGDS
ncbi:MAG: hypothetical protein K9M07_04390 [Simkaniaceae bacterium]|nr:hypothetical protein [Simkaniaceae bacterium]